MADLAGQLPNETPTGTGAWRDVLITPFDAAGERVATTVAGALRARQRTVERPDAHDIAARIADQATGLVIADVTRAHPKVLEQLAAARARGLPTVVLVQDDAQRHVPAGDPQQQVIVYDPDNMGALIQAVGTIRL